MQVSLQSDTCTMPSTQLGAGAQDGEAAEGEEDDPLEGSLKTGVQKLAEGIMRAEGLLPARPTDTDAATAEERRVLGVRLCAQDSARLFVGVVTPHCDND